VKHRARLAEADLKKQGVTNPTPEQIKGRDERSSCRSAADHKGWGRIAQERGFKVGDLVRSDKAERNARADKAGAPGASRQARAAGETGAAGASRPVRAGTALMRALALLPALLLAPAVFAADGELSAGAGIVTARATKAPDRRQDLSIRSWPPMTAIPGS